MFHTNAQQMRTQVHSNAQRVRTQRVAHRPPLPTHYEDDDDVFEDDFGNEIYHDDDDAFGSASPTPQPRQPGVGHRGEQPRPDQPRSQWSMAQPPVALKGRDRDALWERVKGWAREGGWTLVSTGGAAPNKWIKCQLHARRRVNSNGKRRRGALERTDCPFNAIIKCQRGDPGNFVFEFRDNVHNHPAEGQLDERVEERAARNARALLRAVDKASREGNAEEVARLHRAIHLALHPPPPAPTRVRKRKGDVQPPVESAEEPGGTGDNTSAADEEVEIATAQEAVSHPLEQADGKPHSADEGARDDGGEGASTTDGRAKNAGDLEAPGVQEQLPPRRAARAGTRSEGAVPKRKRQRETSPSVARVDRHFRSDWMRVYEANAAAISLLDVDAPRPLQDVAGDGHCGFRVVAAFVYGDDERYQTVREDLALGMRELVRRGVENPGCPADLFAREVLNVSRRGPIPPANVDTFCRLVLGPQGGAADTKYWWSDLRHCALAATVYNRPLVWVDLGKRWQYSSTWLPHLLPGEWNGGKAYGDEGVGAIGMAFWCMHYGICRPRDVPATWPGVAQRWANSKDGIASEEARACWSAAVTSRMKSGRPDARK